MLIDGNALIHRGFHAIPALSTKTGEVTNAVYGFTMILLNAIKDIKPTHIACSFDLAGPTFRHEQYKEYKATRVTVDEGLYAQIPRVHEVVETLGIPIFTKQGFEADDVLGTLAKEICKHCDDDCEVIIVTGDLDTLQLVTPCVKVYTMRKGITDTFIYDEKAVRERFGLSPDQMVDYKALRGDPSDNIPGVKGIGEKTASELIQEFGSFQKLYDAVEADETNGKIKPRILELLKTQKDQALQSYQLSQIVTTVPLEIVINPYVLDGVHLRATLKLFQELEFKSLVSKLPKAEPMLDGEEQEEEKIQVAVKKIDQQYELIEDVEKLDSILEELSSLPEVAIDTETDSLEVVSANLIGLTLCGVEGLSYYIPAVVLKQSKKAAAFLSGTQVKKIGHNLKFDAIVLANFGMPLHPQVFDTMIASYLLNPGNRQHNLETLAFNELGYQMQPIEELIGKGKKQISMAEVPVDKVSWYACEDSDMTLRLKHIFEPLITREKLDKIFYEIEMPLVEVLANLECNGILLDQKMLNKLSGTAEVEINELEQQIYKLTGQEFNINSPKQLKEVLFEKMGLVPVDNKKTKTGISTAAGELEKMLGQHPVIEKLLSYRELAKLQSTYLLALPELVNEKTGRLHTSFNQTVAATGRLSSSDPNLQNIPVRGEGLGSEIRKAFVAAKGFELLSLDYSQIELRIVAHVAQDQAMMDVFKKGEDIHSRTASQIFGVPEDKVTADMRRDAKTINFGILYGISGFGLSERIRDMSRGEAQDYIKKYFAAYPQVEAYIEQVKLQVHEEGFVRNQLGRIRKFPEIKSSQFFIRAAAERAAINFPIQSLAADVIKVAMNNIFTEIKDKPEEIKMLLQVHDELVFEVKEGKVEQWAKKLKVMMEEAISLSVPINAEAKAGKNWGEMKPLNKIDQN